MKGTTLILLALGAGAVYYFEQLNTASNSLQVVFQGVRINGPFNYTLNLIAQNVSNATLELNSLAADVTVNGNDLGNISNFTPVTIGPNSSTAVNVTLAPSVLSIPGTVQALLQNPTGSFDFKVNGNMNINGLVLPLNVEKVIAI